MRQHSVLLIEPDHDNRDMYAYWLRESGFTVQTADTADEGLRDAAAADVVVTGIRVRGPFDGLELVRRLRDDKATRGKPVIVLTACAFQADRQGALSAGCDVFLTKPCLPEQLVSEIRLLLARCRLPKPQPAPAQRRPHGKRRAS